MATYKRPTIQGNLEKIFAAPCAPNPVLYATTAAAAALMAAIEFAQPDAKHLYHYIAGRTTTCAIKYALEENNLVSPDANSLSKNFAWTSLEIAEHTLWYCFLTDLGFDALLNWSSMMVRFQCKSRAEIERYGQGSVFLGGVNYNGDWNSAEFNAQPGSIYYPVTFSHVDVAPYQAYELAGWVEWNATSRLYDTNVACRLVNEDTGEVFMSDMAPPGVTTHTTSMAFHRGYNNHGTHQRYSLQWAWQGEGTGNTTAAVAVRGHLTKWGGL